jgi:uncharacterized membrane-anchored protein
MRKWIILISTVLVLVLVNLNIAAREKLLANGRMVLLETAPVDPRSLMQGDYMVLRFAMADQVLKKLNTSTNKNIRIGGYIIVTLDARGVGRFTRFDNGAPLQANEVKMRYRVRDSQVKFATDAFFFEEGSGERYEAAKYGEFRVANNGDMLLSGLRGADLVKLGK